MVTGDNFIWKSVKNLNLIWAFLVSNQCFSTNSLLAWVRGKQQTTGKVAELGTFADMSRHVGGRILSSENVSFLEQGRIKVELSDLGVLNICSHITAAVNPAAWNRNLSICICSIPNSSLHELF